ncbi:hypothetical protein ACTFIW_007323 [Dictyostelium discoideum]
MNSSHFYGSGSNIGQYGLAGASSWINPNVQHTKPIRPSFKTTEGHYKLIKDVPVEIDQKSFKRGIISSKGYPKVSYYYKGSKNHLQQQQQQQHQSSIYTTPSSSFNNTKSNVNNIINNGNNNNNNNNNNSASSSPSSTSTSSLHTASSSTSINTINSLNLPHSTMGAFTSIEDYQSSSHPSPSNSTINNSNSSSSNSNSSSSSISNSSGSKNSTKKNIIHPTSEKDQLYFSFTNIGNLSLFNFTNIDKAEYEEKINPIHTGYNALCQKIKKLKKNSHLQILVGTDTGEILLFDPQIKPVEIKVFNKDNLEKTKCLCVDWLPNCDDRFIAGFDNGNIMIFDTNRTEHKSLLYQYNNVSNSIVNGNSNVNVNYNNNNNNNNSNSNNNNGGYNNSISGKKQDFKFSVYLQKESRFNPVSLWKVSDKKKVNSFCFSPDGKYIAVACQEGLLNIYDIDGKIHLLSFKSYFGGFLSVDWSRDGKYIATGGEDDFISIFSFEERQLVARGQGHLSWVGCIKFDPYAFPIDSNYYRILSGGEDTRLLLWDFSKDTVLRKQRGKSFSNNKNNNSSYNLNNNNNNNNNNSNNSSDDNSSKEESPSLSSVLSKESQHKANELQKKPIDLNISPPTTPILVNSLSRTVAPIILPIVSHRVHTDPLTDLLCTNDWIVTVSYKKFSIWARPDTVANAQKADSIMCSPNTPSSFTKQYLQMENSWK